MEKPRIRQIKDKRFGRRQPLAVGLPTLTLVILAISSVPAHSTGTEHKPVLLDASPTLNEIVNQAARVATIRITGKRPVNWLGPQRTNSTETDRPCGYEFTAHVVNGLKGGTTDFTFFYPALDSNVEDQREYLIFVFYRDTKKTRLDLRPLNEVLTDEEWSSVICKTFYGDLYIPRAPIFIFPFSRANGLTSKSPELEVGAPSPLIWCREPKANQKSRYFKVRRQLHEGKSLLLMDWLGIEKLISETAASRGPDVEPEC